MMGYYDYYDDPSYGYDDDFAYADPDDDWYDDEDGYSFDSEGDWYDDGGWYDDWEGGWEDDWDDGSGGGWYDDAIWQDQTLRGDARANLLQGGYGNDRLYGEGGNDTLIGNDGADQMTGGSGADVFVHGFNWEGGYDQIMDFSVAEDRLDLSGLNISDMATVADLMSEAGGSAWLDLRADDVTSRLVLYGVTPGQIGAGNLILSTEVSDDEVWGEGGDDDLFGGLGNDDLYGDGGNDALYGEGDDDRLYGEDGADVLHGGAGNDRLDGGEGSDKLFGGAGNDILMGGAGDNALTGGAGYDIFVIGETDGFQRNVIADFERGRDRIDLTAHGISDIATIRALAQDTAHGVLIKTDGHGCYGANLLIMGQTAASLSASDFILSTRRTNDKLVGDLTAEDLFGGLGNDTISGQGGADTLFGEQGNDVLAGGAGADQVHGGAGADVFRYATAGDSRQGACDRIADFNQRQGDRLDLSALDANTRAAGNQAFRYVGGAAFSRAGDLRMFRQNGDMMLAADLNGDRRADFMVNLGRQSTFSTAGLIA
ncbi:calcium-binding protein [Novispirillum sp. DQ9]|uniref:calcium-binding protein n=1 Tax=Novispirillum sp. DQ9 TaxID=3398612 RepID=UPI003C799C58